jgi:hypothetical protein
MDSLYAHAAECECNPEKLPRWMISSGETSTIPDEPQEGTTSLRMRLYRSGRSDLMNSATTGSLNIFSMDHSEGTNNPQIQPASELTRDIVTSTDIIDRNTDTKVLPDKRGETSEHSQNNMSAKSLKRSSVLHQSGEMTIGDITRRNPPTSSSRSSHSAVDFIDLTDVDSD